MIAEKKTENMPLAETIIGQKKITLEGIWNAFFEPIRQNAGNGIIVNFERKGSREICRVIESVPSLQDKIRILFPFEIVQCCIRNGSNDVDPNIAGELMHGDLATGKRGGAKALKRILECFSGGINLTALEQVQTHIEKVIRETFAAKTYIRDKQIKRDIFNSEEFGIIDISEQDYQTMCRQLLFTLQKNYYPTFKDNKEYEWLFIEREETNTQNVIRYLVGLLCAALMSMDTDYKRTSDKESIAATKEQLKVNLVRFLDAEGTKKSNIATMMQKDRTNYYEKLWSHHCKGDIRDMDGTGSVRELVDFFVVPSIAKQDKKIVSEPFSDRRFSKVIMAGSGFGKSTLLDVLLLCNVVDTLDESGSAVLSRNSKDKINIYRSHRKALFGETGIHLFPVFIHSERANKSTYVKALELAEEYDADNFAEMVADAHRAGRLLFLIDSIDEVESDKIGGYLRALNSMLSDYPRANVVCASRFLGKKTLPFECDLLEIKELNHESIDSITFSILSSSVAAKVLDRINSNPYLLSLAKNPFMLLTILETKGDRQVHHLLESIVNAIIDRRWDKYQYDISSEDIKLLLGFLACKFIFDNKSSADLTEIRQCFAKAEDNLKLNGVSYEVPNTNIEYFLRTLSCQSGILNMINQHHVEKYLFQDNLIMCWLAAHYINKIMLQASDVHQWDGLGGIWANIHWIDNFLRTFSSKELALSSDAVNTLVMTLVMISETSGPVIQKSILYYLICRDATSLDEQEQRHICAGYRDIVSNSFGENDITNRSNSDSVKLINKMQSYHR